MAPLRILISNDDGIFADGIKALALAAAARGHQVAVVCPDKERSATGHGLTLQQPIRAERADQLFGQGITAWACSGTPADCVKLAICELLETPPDLVARMCFAPAPLQRRWKAPWNAVRPWP